MKVILKLFFCVLLSAIIWVSNAQSPRFHFQNLNALGSSDRERFIQGCFDHYGNYYIAGYTLNYFNFDLNNGQYLASNYNTPGCFIAKYDENRNILNAFHTKYSHQQLYIKEIGVDALNHLVVAGYYNNTVDLDLHTSSNEYTTPATNNGNIFIAKYDSAFNLIGHHELVALPDSTNEISYDFTFITAMCHDTKGNTFISGYSGDNLTDGSANSYIPEFSYFVIKYDSIGNFIWRKRSAKVIHHFYNWTNFRPVLITCNRQDELFLSMTFCDSIDYTFGNGQFASAIPYTYDPPFIEESTNTDALLVKFDQDGNYLQHTQLKGDSSSRQEVIGLNANPSGFIHWLIAYDASIQLPDTNYTTIGYDAQTPYNLVLAQLNNQLYLTKHLRYYVNMLHPQGDANTLISDECGNNAIRIQKFIADAYPFPSFQEQNRPIIDKSNIYFFNNNLTLGDSILHHPYLPDFNHCAMSYGFFNHGFIFSDQFSIGTATISENTPNPNNPAYDIALSGYRYNYCNRLNEGELWELTLPNVFSPNNDGINDTFIPKVATGIFNLRFTIYNRWGKLLFTSNLATSFWNGTYENKNCEDGVYFFSLSFEAGGNMQERHGTISIVH